MIATPALRGRDGKNLPAASLLHQPLEFLQDLALKFAWPLRGGRFQVRGPSDAGRVWWLVRMLRRRHAACRDDAAFA